MFKILVYGTLRPFTNTNKTTVKGRLYDLGAFPGLILDESGDDVVCEVIEVTEKELFILDMYEGYRWDDPRNSLYIRRELPCKAYVYEYNQPHPTDKPIEPDWESYKGGWNTSRLPAVLGKDAADRIFSEVVEG